MQADARTTGIRANEDIAASGTNDRQGGQFFSVRLTVKSSQCFRRLIHPPAQNALTGQDPGGIPSLRRTRTSIGEALPLRSSIWALFGT